MAKEKLDQHFDNLLRLIQAEREAEKEKNAEALEQYQKAVANHRALVAKDPSVQGDLEDLEQALEEVEKRARNP